MFYFSIYVFLFRRVSCINFIHNVRQITDIMNKISNGIENGTTYKHYISVCKLASMKNYWFPGLKNESNIFYKKNWNPCKFEIRDRLFVTWSVVSSIHLQFQAFAAMSIIRNITFLCFMWHTSWACWIQHNENFIERMKSDVSVRCGVKCEFLLQEMLIAVTFLWGG